MAISQVRHPDYLKNDADWRKYRDTYTGGRCFIDRYLKKFSTREDDTDFYNRKAITYCPSFAKAAIDEIKNAIFQRMADVVRVGGPENYQRASVGEDFGVDNDGNTMNAYMGCRVLPELLSMGRVGVFIDKPNLKPLTLRDELDVKPYLYIYQTEDILSWNYEGPGQKKHLSSVLLRENYWSYDEETGLPNGTAQRLRHVWLDSQGVHVQFYDTEDKPLGEKFDLEIKYIPFVIFELPQSLLKDVADYQIALLNLESSDINYAIKSNFPFYVEQFDPRWELGYKQEYFNEEYSTNTGETDGTEKIAEVEDTRTYQAGAVHGRRYPLNTNQPAFIHPSSEPLEVSMKKGEQIKRDIRLLVNLAVSQLSDKMASAESKGWDNQGLENGLSYIGNVLETGERLIALYWAAYEGKKSATVNYPENYNLKSEEQRRSEATDLEAILHKIPSDKFKRTILKRITRILLSGNIPQSEILEIEQQIDEAPTVTSDPDAIHKDLEVGLVGLEDASHARGYRKGQVEIAKQEHAERIARIKEAQGGEDGAARGDKDTQMAQPTSRTEKLGKPKRGAGKDLKK